eukprot:3221547-Lingulodinium_polyedra.AAC.1
MAAFLAAEAPLPVNWRTAPVLPLLRLSVKPRCLRAVAAMATASPAASQSFSGSSVSTIKAMSSA